MIPRPMALPLQSATPKVISAAPMLHTVTVANHNPTVGCGIMLNTNPTDEVVDKYTAAINTLNAQIFANMTAGLPIILFIGNLPEDMDDDKFTRILECCGRVYKWVRPCDPVTLSVKNFGFVTFTQAVGGLRCLTLMNNFLLDASEGIIICVKAATRLLLLLFLSYCCCYIIVIILLLVSYIT